MSPISSSSASNPVVSSSTSAVADLQKQQRQPQAQDLREKAKPAVEDVVISKQAQAQLDADKAANAPNQNASSANNNTEVNAAQALETVNTVQNRQTAAAVAQYAKQQAEASPPKLEPREEAKPSTSIKAIA